MSTRVAQPKRRFFTTRRLLLVVFMLVAFFCYGRPWIGSDGVAHYALTESLVRDHDFDLTNQLYLVGLAPQGFDDYRPLGGRISSWYSGGTAVLNAPFLYAALQLRAVLAHYHIVLSQNVYLGRPDFLAEASILFASACFYFLTILTTVAIFQRRPEDSSVLGGSTLDPYLVAIAVSLGLPLFYYSFSEPSFPHAADTLIVTLGFWVFAFRRHLRVRTLDLATPLLGFLLGFAIFIRNVNLALVPPYMGYLLLDETRVARTVGASSLTRAGQALLKLVGGLLTAALMIGAYNWYCYGSPARFGYAIMYPDKIVSPTLGNAGEIGKLFVFYLIHPVRGLLIWSPIAILAALSAYQNRRQFLTDDRLFVAATCPLFAFLGLSLWRDWWAGYSFGQRFATMLFPFFAYLIWGLRWPARRTVVALLTGVAYSFVLMHFYVLAHRTSAGLQTLSKRSFGVSYTPLDLLAFAAYELAAMREHPITALGALIFRDSLIETIPRLTLQYQDQAPPQPGHYPVTYTSPHIIGALEREGGRGWVLQGRQGEVGYLLYGPYDTLPPGRYTGHFVLQVPGRPPNAVVAILDVAASALGVSGLKQFASASLHGKDFRRVGAYQTFDLEFVLDQFSRVELRVYSTGKTVLRVLETSLTRNVPS